MTKFCYRKHACSGEGASGRDDVQFCVWHPSLWRWRIAGEHVSLKTIIVRIYFWVLSRGRFAIAYASTPEGCIVHTSYIVGSRFKFPFMGPHDYEIGPCFTDKRFRGRGIYPSVLRHIIQNKSMSGEWYWMNVDENNISSIRGIEKAGFERVGESTKSRWLKIYKITRQEI